MMDDFTRFHDAVELWMARLGLGDWIWQVRQEDLGPDLDTTRARVSLNWVQRKAGFVWNTGWRGARDVTIVEPPEAQGFHEVVHVMLCSLVNVAVARGENANETLAEEHAIIQRLARAFAQP